MASSLELARRVYDLLVNRHKEGLSRLALAQKLGTDDRSARDAVNACRTLAATHPKADGSVYIVGYDPEQRVYCAAQDACQAARIIAYQSSRQQDLIRTLDAQKSAYEKMFGAEYRENAQGRLEL